MELYYIFGKYLWLKGEAGDMNLKFYQKLRDLGDRMLRSCGDLAAADPVGRVLRRMRPHVKVKMLKDLH